MPIYEYRCLSCGQQFDRLFASFDQVPPSINCPTCGSHQVRRLISAAAVRVGEPGSQGQEEEPEPIKPPIFGRKELNEALEQKRRLADQE